MSDSGNVIRAFGVDHVTRLTGLSKARLTRWDKLGFFPPEYADDDRRNPYSRVYSFADVVGLKTLAVLTDDYKVPLKELTKAAVILSKLVEKPWSETKLYVLNRKVVFNEPDTGNPRNVTDGQYVSKHIPLQSIADEIRNKSELLKQRGKEQIGKIERHKFVARNSWVVMGTRIPVAAIKEFREEGFTTEQILFEFPMLTLRDVRAAIRHKEHKRAA